MTPLQNCLFLSKNGEVYSFTQLSHRAVFRREEDIVLVIHVEVVWLLGEEGITFGSEHKSTRTNGATELTTAMIIRGVSSLYSERETGTSERHRDRRLNTQPLSHLRNKQAQQRHDARLSGRVCGLTTEHEVEE